MVNPFFQERIDPFDGNPIGFIVKSEHVGRYIFAKNFAKRHRIKTVFDVGSGTGYGARMLNEAGIQTFGFDKTRNNNTYSIDLDTQDLTFYVKNKKLPVPGMMISFETMEHLKNPEIVLKQIHKILPDHHYFIFSVPNGTFEPKRNGRSRDIFHKHVFYQRDILPLLEQAGFRIVEWRWQPVTNFMFHRIKLLLPLLDRFISSHKSILEFFSLLVAYPIPFFTPFSYSMIVVAQKT